MIPSHMNKPSNRTLLYRPSYNTYRQPYRALCFIYKAVLQATLIRGCMQVGLYICAAWD